MTPTRGIGMPARIAVVSTTLHSRGSSLFDTLTRLTDSAAELAAVRSWCHT